MVLRCEKLCFAGMVDPADLLTNLEEEINKAQQEVASRKEIMVLMEKWMSACEEEGWLEDYNKVQPCTSICVSVSCLSSLST